MSTRIRNSIFNLTEGHSSGGGWTFSKIIADANTVSIYDRLALNGRVEVAGVESIYWDLKYPYMTLGVEQNSGVIVLYAVYKITVTSANYFYAGCQVGDVFACGVVKTCTVNNKVQRVLGNHLTQPVVAKRFVNGIGDGISQFMKTAPFNFVQPEFVYFVGKQITWTASDILWDGNIYHGGNCVQSGVTPKIIIDAFGGQMTALPDLPLDQLGIIRACYNGIYSKMIINNNKPMFGLIGTYDMGGFTIGAAGVGTAFYSNIYFAGAILRNEVADEDKEVLAYNVLGSRFAISKPDTRNTFDNGKVVLALDGSTPYVKAALDVLVAQGVKSSVYPIPEDFGSPNMDWDYLRAYRAAGGDVQMHPAQTNTGLTVQQVIDIYNAYDIVYAAEGFTYTHIAYMGNNHDANVDTATLACGKTGRGGVGGYNTGVSPVGGIIYLEFRKAGSGFATMNGDNIGKLAVDNWKAKFDRAKLMKGCYECYFHGKDKPLVDGDDGLTEAEILEIIAYGNAIGIDFITKSELDGLMEH